ncbi:HNH endonuclease [Kitasatospora sp. NPDC048540]|uniref:HNH endonuclease n=1 Tax=unclassified Kitasatospora TaxID=2633591 RepID=UPI000ADCA8A3|nr:HNH endonuclease [Kitasatospora sp. MBT63]
MIPLQRPPLRPALLAELERRTRAIDTAGPTTATGRAAWRNARQPKAQLRLMLRQMAPGLERCMYCGDNLGTDIDHFEPIARAPLRTFDWQNHLLACAHCNSNHKRDRFPLDPVTGAHLLVDPSREDPADHLMLYLESGAYDPLTPKGEATIDVFALNSRAELVRGRRMMFTVVKAVLAAWHRSHQAGAPAEAGEYLDALRLLNHADVLRAVLRLRHRPALAEAVLGPQVLLALEQLVKVSREFG